MRRANAKICPETLYRAGTAPAHHDTRHPWLTRLSYVIERTATVKNFNEEVYLRVAHS